MIPAIIINDNLWQDTLTAAAHFRMPKGLRNTFAYILLFGDGNNPLQLWNDFRERLTEDFTRNNLQQPAADVAALQHIDRVLRQQGRTLRDFLLPEVEDIDNPVPVDVFAANQALYKTPPFNLEQQDFADAVLHSMGQWLNGERNVPRCFYLDGPAGTGKTFTYNFT